MGNPKKTHLQKLLQEEIVNPLQSKHTNYYNFIRKKRWHIYNCYFASPKIYYRIPINQNKYFMYN